MTTGGFTGALVWIFGSGSVVRTRRRVEKLDHWNLASGRLHLRCYPRFELDERVAADVRCQPRTEAEHHWIAPVDHPDRQARIGVLKALLDRGDLDRAVSAFAELDLRDQPVVMGEVGAGLVRADPERALEWLMGLDETLRRNSYDWVITEMYGVNASVTKRLMQGIADPELRIGAATAVAHWEMGDPEAGLA